MPEGETGLEGILHEKVGGIPAPVVGGLGAVGIIGVLWLRKRYSSPAATATDTTNASSVTSDGSGAYDPNAIDPQTGLTAAQEQFPSGPLDTYLAGNPQSASYPVGLTPQGLPGPITNVQWARLAGDYLMGRGEDPALVANALQNFVEGKPLTTAEQAVISTALRTFGEPPEGILPVTPSPVPVGSPPPAPSPVPPPPGTGGGMTVPNVVGMRVEDAVEALQDAGFRASFGPRRPGVSYHVTGQNPRAGARVRFGEASLIGRTVRLTIAPIPKTPVPVREEPGGPARGLQFTPPEFP